MFWNIIIAIASYALQLALTPKPQNAKAKSLEDFQAPTAEEGREIPVVFGTSDIADPNVTWYGDLKKTAIKGARRYGLFGPRQILGYKYSLGVQMGLCHGPADYIKSIRVGDKEAWRGNSAGGRITINQENLFGGDQSEGGIAGDVDICMGAPDQLQNDYLVSRLGANISAFRGVVTAVMRQVYLGTSNYIKPWEIRVQRIYLRSDGTEQWYAAKAGIAANTINESLAVYFAIDTSFTDFGLYYELIALRGALAKLEADGTDCDIRMVSFSTTIKTSIERRSVDAAGFDDLEAWLAALTTDDVHADYDAGVSEAATFFSGAGSKRRVVILISDDDAATGTPTAAAATLGAIDDVFIHCYMFGRFALTSPNMNIVDNTPEDQQESGNCPIFLTGSDALFSALVAESIPLIDMNPAHIIRECLTDTTWGMGYNDADIDDDTFTAAADTLYSESFGLTLKWNQEEEIQEFVSTVLSHIDAFLYVSRSTGKFVLKLIRNDYDIDTIPVLDEDDVIEWTEVKHRQPSEASSSVLVKFYLRERRKNAAHLVTNLAQAMQATKVLPTTRNYPGITKSSLAIRVATRDVISLGSGLTSGRLIGKRTIEGLNPGDPFRLISARHRLSGEVMRVADLTFGDGRANKIGVKYFQDVFNLSASVLVDDSNSGGWEPPSNAPLPVSPRLVWEMPFRELRQMIGDADLATMLLENPDAGLLQIAGASPTPDATNAEIQIDAGAGYSSADTLDFAPGAFLDGDVAIDATEITITGSIDFDLAVEGTLATIGNGSREGTEVIRIDDIDGNTLTISRGFLDTVPKAHLDGAAVVLFDDFSTSDFEKYTVSQDVDIKLLTITGAGALALAAAPADTVDFDSRAVRPLPPKNAQLDGTGYGTLDAVAIDPIPATWVRRNRLTELSPALSWTDADVTPEDGQTTTLNLTDEDGAVVHSYTALSGTNFDIDPADFGALSAGYVEFDSEREGYTAWQAHRIRVLLASRLLLSGDEQSGADHLALSGDEAGSVLKLS